MVPMLFVRWKLIKKNNIVPPHRLYDDGSDNGKKPVLSTHHIDKRVGMREHRYYKTSRYGRKKIDFKISIYFFFFFQSKTISRFALLIFKRFLSDIGTFLHRSSSPI